MKPIIICADDYAQSPAIDEAILTLIAQNRLSATSCMVLSPRWDVAAKALTSAVRTKADIGLHLDFTHFGQAYAHPKLIAHSHLRNLPTQRIQQSIHTQLDRFEQALGTPPDYVDGHQHVHQLPQIRDLLLNTLKARYPHQLPWIRIAKPPSGTGLKASIIKLLGANALERSAKQMGFACSGYLLGVYDFSGDCQQYESQLTQWISSIPAVVNTSLQAHTPVLMCHPAIHKPGSELNDPIYQARLNEFSVLNSDKIDTLFKMVRLVRQPIFRRSIASSNEAP